MQSTFKAQCWRLSQSAFNPLFDCTRLGRGKLTPGVTQRDAATAALFEPMALSEFFRLT
jgi:hypothetical protein